MSWSLLRTALNLGVAWFGQGMDSLCSDPNSKARQGADPRHAAECWLLFRSMPHGLPVLLVGGVHIDRIGLVVERMGKYTEPFQFTDVGLARPEARHIETLDLVKLVAGCLDMRQDELEVQILGVLEYRGMDDGLGWRLAILADGRC